MEDNIFNVTFTAGGKDYSGMVNPAQKTRENGMPVSFHVILNHVHFGNLSFDNHKWLVDEQRPADLIATTGNAIQAYYADKNWFE